MDKPKIITFLAKRGEFYFLGVEQAVTPATDFGAVWDNYFKTVEGSGFASYDYVIWYCKNREQIFFPGKVVDGTAEVPNGFNLVKFPACEYLVVTHEWMPAGGNLYTGGILPTQNYIGIGQTQEYKENAPMPEGYARYDGPDDPITQIEIEAKNPDSKDSKRFERWVPVKKI